MLFDVFVEGCEGNVREATIRQTVPTKNVGQIVKVCRTRIAVGREVSKRKD
jgi:hypothetical protein